MTVTALLRVGRNVADLASATKFYVDACGFQPAGPVTEDAALAQCLGVERVRVQRLKLGGQALELSECFPNGAPYPQSLLANDVAFQHIALITAAIEAACDKVRHLGAKRISSNGPAHLPASSGNVVAFKFRDPEGHPLEFLQFPANAGKPPAGYDHSAISVSDVDRSVAFYARLGVILASKQVNRGLEQDALDGLAHVAVDVVALQPPRPAPHVELLCYRQPKAGAPAPYAPGDICADRLVFGAADGGLTLLRDPDGHVVLIDGRE